MAINRELSQFASFVEVDNTSKNIGIAATATPYVGIGTTNPTAKLDVVGQTELDDVNISGISTLSQVDIRSGIITGLTHVRATNAQVTGVSTVGFITASNIFVSGISTISNIAFIPQGSNGGIVTASDNVGIITYYGDGSQLSGIGGAPGGVGANTQVVYNDLGNFAGSSNFTFDGSNVYIAGIATAQDFDSLSDVRYKINIDTVDDALLKVIQLRGVKFNWKESGLPSYGVIAQELEQILPELVHGNDPKTVNYNGIIGVLIEAIKKLNQEISYLKEKLDK